VLAVYFGSWRWLKERAAREVGFYGWDTERVLAVLDVDTSIPFVVSQASASDIAKRSYYFWFFGYVAKLPYERELD
jgi:hypothetical protein